jgi:hypothetical protein
MKCLIWGGGDFRRLSLRALYSSRLLPGFVLLMFFDYPKRTILILATFFMAISASLRKKSDFWRPIIRFFPTPDGAR